MDVELLGITDLSVLDDAVCLEETIFGILVVSSIDRLREHCVAKVSDREVTAYRGKKSKSQLKSKAKKQEIKTKV